MYWSRKMLTFVVWFVATTIASADVADDDFRVASRQFSRKRWAPAATELAAFLNDHPDDPRSADARYLLGESLVQLRRYPEARKHLNQFLRQTDDHRYTRQAEFRAAESAFHAADHVAARTELEAFRQRYPDDALSPYVMAYLGEIALIDRDGQTAVVMFSEVLQRETVSRLDSQCRFGLAQAHELLGNAEEAMRLYGQAVEPASRYSQQAQFRIAMLQYRQAGYDKAELILEHLAATLDGDLLFETQYWLGMSRLRQQNWLAAAQALQEGLEDSPAHRLAPGRRFALAEALRKSGRRDEAKEHYTTVFELDPPADWSDDAGQILVLLAWEGGNLPGVHEMVQRFFDRFPLSSLADDVRQHQGRALLKERDFAMAARMFERLLEMDVVSGEAPHSAEHKNASHQSTNRYYLAIAYLGAGRPADVLRVLPAMEIDGHDVAALNDGLRVARASALMALGRYEQAIDPLRAYVAAHPRGADSVDCHAKLIVALGETGQWYSAAESFDWFRNRHPESVALQTTGMFLADLALAQGMHDVAEPLYRFLADGVTATRDEAADSGTAADEVADGLEPQPAKVFSHTRIFKALTGLARSQFDRGRFLEAAQTSSRLLALSPPPHVATNTLLLQGRAFEADEQPNAALASYQQIYEYDPMCEPASSALFAAARILADQGHRQQACERLEQLVRQDAVFEQRDGALYQLAWLLLETGDQTQADLRFVQLVKEHQRSPLWVDAMFRLARNAAERNDVTQANYWLDELLFGVARNSTRDHQRPHDTQRDSTTTTTDISRIVCHALYLQGKLAVDAGEWLASLRSYQRIVEEYPQSDLASAASFWSAESQFHLAHYEQADAMLAQQQFTATDSHKEYQAMIPLRRAQIAVHRRKWADALEMAQGIRDRFPDFSLQFEVDYLIGRCLHSQAHFSMARQSFRRVIDAPQARRTETAAMAQWMIGETYFHQSNYNDAIRAYYRVDALYALPRWQAAALLQAAKCHELNDQWKEAQQLYSQLRSDYPESRFAAEAMRRLRIATKNRAE
ncbi:MAG: hypothetical protein CMJ50_05775 [Planctomycetaceae bacterium]|nr:hypothetical protein [Planctomycetaceae bacterium]